MEVITVCTRPMKAFIVPDVKTDNGKDVLILRSINTPFVDLGAGKPVLTDYTLIPCGKCKECKLQSAKEWAIRCSAEAQLYPENYNYFLTLTYDNAHLPVCNWLDPVSGEYIGTMPTLSKEDIKRFLDRLRSYFKYHYNHDGIRFFGCGEYGPRTGRPHYHLILFNCPLFLLPGFPSPQNYDHVSDLGNPLYSCQKLTELWGNGAVDFAQNTPDTAAYTARYCLKKANLPGEGFIYVLKDRSKRDPVYCEYYHHVVDYDYKRSGYLMEADNLEHWIKLNPDDYNSRHEEVDDYLAWLYAQADIYTVPRPEGQQFEFTVMSTKPGIGRSYFEKHYSSLYEIDECWVTGHKTKIPRYFDVVLEAVDKELHDSVKANRQEASLLRRIMQEEDFNIERWSDTYDLKSRIVDDYSKVYKRGDF